MGARLTPRPSRSASTLGLLVAFIVLATIAEQWVQQYGIFAGGAAPASSSS